MPRVRVEPSANHGRALVTTPLTNGGESRHCTRRPSAARVIHLIAGLPLIDSAPSRAGHFDASGTPKSSTSTAGGLTLSALTSTLLVTGGAGFIGSNFVHRVLATRAEKVVVFDRLTYAGNLDNLVTVAHDRRFSFVRGDIADRDSIRAAIAAHRPTAILNFAAESHVDRSIDGPGEFVRTNIQGTFEVLEATRHHLATLTPAEAAAFRLLHVSTDEVYGSLGETGLFREDTPYAPNSPYAASKAAADHLVRAYRETYGLPAIITNCSNNYGPYQFPEKLIPLMILNALEGKSLPIYGSGTNVRDWIHVEDHCAGVLLALDRGAPGGKYNLGGGNERTNLQVIEALCQALERRRPAAANAALVERGARSYQDLKTFVADRPGHDRRYAIDSTLAQRELGWAASRTFEQGIDDTVGWYLEHAAWCENVQSGGYRRERLGLETVSANASRERNESSERTERIEA